MGQSLTSSWEHVFYTFWIKNTGKFVHGFLPRPSPGLAGTAHFGMTQTLFRDYWQRYSINRRISKDTQINFWPVLFESNEKMKYIHKNSDPPT